MKGESFKGVFEATKSLGCWLWESWVEATSLGLKTKLGLGPNYQKYKHLYTSER